MPEDRFPLALSPDRLSLGMVAAGKKAKASLSVTNWGQATVAVDRIHTSCPCLTVIPSSIRLAPGETSKLTVDFNPSSEPDFRGGLTVDITAYADGAVVFRTQASLRVVAGSSDGAASGEQEDPS